MLAVVGDNTLMVKLVGCKWEELTEWKKMNSSRQWESLINFFFSRSYIKSVIEDIFYIYLDAHWRFIDIFPPHVGIIWSCLHVLQIGDISSSLCLVPRGSLIWGFLWLETLRFLCMWSICNGSSDSLQKNKWALTSLS